MTAHDGGAATVREKSSYQVNVGASVLLVQGVAITAFSFRPQCPDDRSIQDLSTSRLAAPRHERDARAYIGLLQFGVFGFGLLQDRDIGVGVFPHGKEVLVSFLGLCLISLQRIRPA